MKKYICSFDGHEVDLDDLNTYKYLPDDARILDDIMFKEIGQAYTYMNYFHRNIYPKKRVAKKNPLYWCWKQRERVEGLIKTFVDGRSDNWKNLKWFKEQVFLFQDETENMC